MGPRSVRILLVVAGLITLASAYNRVRTAPLLSETANVFLASLDPDRIAKATFSVDDENRSFWHFIPTPDVAKRYDHPRPGLTLADMTPEQRHLAGALLAAGLSAQGYVKARTVMSLEEVLRVLEGDSGERRNPLRYHFSVFGKPSEKGTWGYRVEGHHLSLHYTLVDGRLAGAPTFFGANPRQIPSGPRKGGRALPHEEDLGRALVRSLDPQQLKVALVSEKAYPDILTSADRKAVLEGQPNGLPVSKMTAAQRRLLDELVEEYASNMPPEIASHRLEQYQGAGDDLHFAWAGSLVPGEAHYYRLRAPAFLIEYDCIQNQANHIHSVWRDWEGDFGLDLLKAHYQTAHR